MPISYSNGQENIDILLNHGEDSRVEYKRELHFSNKVERAEFVRDLIAMANAHETSTGYILIGVAEGTPPTLYDALGLSLDDGTLHGFTDEYIDPPVAYNFRYVKHQSGTTLGMVMTPPSEHRFHVVKKDFRADGCDKKLLERGRSWIRRGARRDNLTGFDMQRLKETWLRQHVPPQPDLHLTFDDGSERIDLTDLWRQPIFPVRFVRAVSRIVRGFAVDSGFAYGPGSVQMPVGTMGLSFRLHNRGCSEAENVEVQIDLPQGCRWWPGSVLFQPTKATSNWSTNAYWGCRNVQLKGPHLVHGRDRISETACITFPSPDRAYEFRWTAYAGNMAEPRTGSLIVAPKPEL